MDRLGPIPYHHGPSILKSILQGYSWFLFWIYLESLRMVRFLPWVCVFLWCVKFSGIHLFPFHGNNCSFSKFYPKIVLGRGPEFLWFVLSCFCYRNWLRFNNGWYELLSKKAPTFREDMNCKSYNMRESISNPVPQGMRDLKPDKPSEKDGGR